MDREATIEYPADFDPLAALHVEVEPLPPTRRTGLAALDVAADAVELARAGSDPGIDEAIGWLDDEDVVVVEEGGAG